MVSTVTAYEFSAVIDGFLAQKKITGPHGALITATIRERALKLLSHADVRYMPAFKILDILAAFVNIGGAIADAPQLRPAEVRALLRESLSDGTPLLRQFMLEAALERARYEPLMLEAQTKNASAERTLILQRRWAAMRAAHQDQSPLPDSWIERVDSAVEQALAARDFARFRQGPLLQMFAEMLALARKYHQQSASLTALETALSPDAALWRRYALKSSRYREKVSAAADIGTIQPPHTIH